MYICDQLKTGQNKENSDHPYLERQFLECATCAVNGSNAQKEALLYADNFEIRHDIQDDLPRYW